MSKTSFVQRSIIQMQSRSGNKCHLQCPQQANAIAKPNLRRYLSVWSTAQRRTCRARCRRPVCRLPPSRVSPRRVSPRRVSPRRVPPRRTCLAVCRRADAYRRTAANASRPARNFVRITTWSPSKIGVYAPAFFEEINRDHTVILEYFNKKE